MSKKRRFSLAGMKASQAPPSQPRPNGAKSPGPSTPQAKTAILLNAIKHRLTAKSILLPGEDPAALKALADSLLGAHQPATDEEFLLLEELVANKWRIRRMWESEQSLVRVEMLRQKQAAEAEFQAAESDILYAVALQKLTDDSKTLAHIHRQEVRYTRAADRALNQLRIAQTLRRELHRELENVENSSTPESPVPNQPANTNETNHLKTGNTKIQNNPKPPENYPPEGVASMPTEHLHDEK